MTYFACVRASKHCWRTQNYLILAARSAMYVLVLHITQANYSEGAFITRVFVTSKLFEGHTLIGRDDVGYCTM